MGEKDLLATKRSDGVCGVHGRVSGRAGPQTLQREPRRHRAEGGRAFAATQLQVPSIFLFLKP